MSHIRMCVSPRGPVDCRSRSPPRRSRPASHSRDRRRSRSRSPPPRRQPRHTPAPPRPRSPSPVPHFDVSPKVEEAVSSAKAEVGSNKWSFWTNRAGFSWIEPKCNLFVYEMLQRGKIPVPVMNSGSTKRSYLNTANWFTEPENRPPTAEQWRAGLVPGWEIVAKADARAGDLATDGSHIGIVSKPGRTVSASARTNTVIDNTWGWRQGQDNVVFLRYTGRLHSVAPCGTIVHEGGKLVSSNERFYLKMQADGHLVCYTKEGGVVFKSGTAGKGKQPYLMCVQPDGNLVLYHSGNTKAPTWASNTAGRGACRLVLEDNGKLWLRFDDGSARHVVE